MQSGVLLRCKLRRHFGGVALHNSALRIISVLQITAKRRVRTRSDPRTLAARKAAPVQGEISVLSGAPYGYRYERKSDEQAGGYAVIDAEAQMVRQIYELYTA